MVIKFLKIDVVCSKEKKRKFSFTVHIAKS